MITVLAYIINMFAPIVNAIGAIGLCVCVVYEALHVLAIAGAMAVVGFVFGIFAYRLDVPPRWFWSKSKNELFEFSISAVLGYAWSFAMWPCAVYLVRHVLVLLQNKI